MNFVLLIFFKYHFIFLLKLRLNCIVLSRKWSNVQGWSLLFILYIEMLWMSTY